MRWVLIIIFIFNIANAKECKPEGNEKNVDLTKDFGPQRDQGATSWCFAHQTADLMDHYRYRKTGNKEFLEADKRTSANFLAWIYYKDEPWYMGLGRMFEPGLDKDELEKCARFLSSSEQELCEQRLLSEKYLKSGGIPKRVMKQIDKWGYCLEKDAASDSFDLRGNYYLGFEIRSSEDYHKLFGILFREESDLIPERTDFCQKAHALKALAPGAKLTDIMEILKRYSKKEYLDKAFELACPATKRYKIKPEPEYFEDMIGSGDFLSIPLRGLQDWTRKNEKRVKKINKLLDQGIPVGLTLDTRWMEPQITQEYAKEHGLDPVHVNFDTDKGLIKWSSINSMHALTIAGKKFDPKTCDYVYTLRNSWGNSCGGITQDFRFEHKKAAKNHAKLKLCTQSSVEENEYSTLYPKLTSKINTDSLYTEIERAYDSIHGTQKSKSMRDNQPKRPSIEKPIEPLQKSKKIGSLMLVAVDKFGKEKKELSDEEYAVAMEKYKSDLDEYNKVMQVYEAKLKKYYDSIRVQVVRDYIQYKKEGRIKKNVEESCYRENPLTVALKARGISCDTKTGEITITAEKLKKAMLGINYIN